MFAHLRVKFTHKIMSYDQYTEVSEYIEL